MISRLGRCAVFLVVAFLNACDGDDGTGPGATFESLVGTYTGTIVAMSDGVVLAADFGITMD